MPYDIGDAIAAKSGLSAFHYRRGFDVSMPVVGLITFTDAERHSLPADRKYLLVFRGLRSKHDYTRLELSRIHNGVDVLICVACRAGYDDDDCRDDEAEFGKHSYRELASDSKFALIVEGFGYATFRLTEMMSAGSIPVILIDHYVLPYDDILDWENFSIRIPEHKLEQVPDILRAIPAERVAAMHARLVFVYETFFRSLGTQVHLAIESVRINLFTVDREAERVKLITNGFPYELSAEDLTTPVDVKTELAWCHVGMERRVHAQDGSLY